MSRIDPEPAEPSDGVGERFALGAAVWALIEPHRGHERAFHRWYERDHLPALGAAAPGSFATAHWHATAPLRALRTPDPSPVAAPLAAGSHLSAIWIEAGGIAAQQGWVDERMQALGERDRHFAHRDHVFTHRYRYRGGALRDEDGVPPELALQHGYGGVVCTWVERASATGLDTFAEALREEWLPARLDAPGARVAMSLVFSLMPKPEHWPAAIPAPPGLEERLLVAHFVEGDPAASWDAHFTRFGDELAASGLGRLLLAAPFVPTTPGVDPPVGDPA